MECAASQYQPINDDAAIRSLRAVPTFNPYYPTNAPTESARRLSHGYREARI